MPINAEYLKETFYCDVSSPIVKNCAKPFIGTKDTEKDIAVNIFNHVRDKYALCAGKSKAKASETMEKGYGTCWNKALVALALLRSCAIPCRLIKHPLKRDFLKPLLGYDYLFLNNPYNHFFIQANVDGNWRYADPSLDSKAYEKLYRPLKVSWGLEWDGKSDHIIHTNKSMGPLEIIEDIDGEIAKAGGNRPTPSLLIPLLNRKYWKKQDGIRHLWVNKRRSRGPNEKVSYPPQQRGHKQFRRQQGQGTVG